MLMYCFDPNVALLNMLQNHDRMMLMIDGLKERLKTEGVVTFRVKARPQAQANRFRGPLGDDTFKVDVAATPEGGQANAELVRFLADEFEVNRDQVEIVSGETSRLKIVRLVK